MQQTAKLIALLFGVLFLALGTIPAYLAFSLGSHSRHMVQSGLHADGVISEYTLIGHSSKQRYWPVVRFTTAAGQAVSFIEMNDRLSKGNFPVLYRADNPQIAVVDDFKTLWKWPLISLIASALLLFIGCTAIYRSLTRL